MAGTRIQAVAPGRVNLIGDHTDYNGGLALPMAVDLATTVDLWPDGTDRLVLGSDLDGRVTELVTPVGDPARTAAGQPSWARLAAAVLAELAQPTQLAQLGELKLRFGGRATVTSSLPVGAGLSSSAAFSVALALALGAPADPLELARLVQRAEEATGASVGLMDPLVAVAARAGSALMIDFAGPAWRPVTLPGDLEVVVVHSGQQRQLTASPYGERRRQCEAAARLIGRPLGQARLEDLATLEAAENPAAVEGRGRRSDPVLVRRARHVLTECRRVRTFADALERGDGPACGRLLLEGHRSLADDFECSTPEIDTLVAALAGRPGVHGARMTGGGFGGCVVALGQPGALDPGECPGRAWRVVPAGGAFVRRFGAEGQR